MPNRNLPPNQNLEHYKKIAKNLLKAWKSKVPAEVVWENKRVLVSGEHIRDRLAALRRVSPVSDIRLADVHFLIAREYGYENWADFSGAIRAGMDDSPNPVRRLNADYPQAISAVRAIREGDVEKLFSMLDADASLASGWIVDQSDNSKFRSLLHIATDWPGHFPRVRETIAALVGSGADADAAFIGASHRERPLHWAASSGDLEALDALIEAGANIEAVGAVIAGGTPMSDAVAFAQWPAARRLVEVGARTNLDHECALGLTDRITERLSKSDSLNPESIHQAFWFACHGGQRTVAERLLALGADPKWRPPWESLTARGAAERSGFRDLAEWLDALTDR